MTVLKVEFKGVKQFKKSLARAESQVERKAQQALNRTLTRSRTQMTKMIGEKLNLKKKTIRDMIVIHKANKNTGLIGRLIVKNNPVSLIEYKAKQNRKGVSFKMFRNRPRKLIRHAFIHPDSRDKDTVFRRKTKARLKIKPLYGSSVSHVAKNYVKDVGQQAVKYMATEVNRLLSARMKKTN